jgi:hypothetical protein
MATGTGTPSGPSMGKKLTQRTRSSRVPGGDHDVIGLQEFPATRFPAASSRPAAASPPTPIPMMITSNRSTCCLPIAAWPSVARSGLSRPAWTLMV